MGLWPQGDAFHRELPFRKMRRWDRQSSACARLRDSRDCGKLQFTRIFTRDFCFYKACRLARLRGIRRVSLSAKQEKEFSWGVRFDSSTLLPAPSERSVLRRA